MDIVQIGLFLAYTLLFVAVLAAFVMPFVQALMQDPKSLIKPAIGLVGILVLYGIAYAISSNEVTVKYAEFGVDSAISGMVGGLLNTMYILMFAALGGIIYTEIAGALK